MKENGTTKRLFTRPHRKKMCGGSISAETVDLQIPWLWCAIVVHLVFGYGPRAAADIIRNYIEEKEKC